MITENERGKFVSDGISRLAGLLKDGRLFSIESTLGTDGKPTFEGLTFAVKHSDGTTENGVIKL